MNGRGMAPRGHCVAGEKIPGEKSPSGESQPQVEGEARPQVEGEGASMEGFVLVNFFHTSMSSPVLQFFLAASEL